MFEHGGKKFVELRVLVEETYFIPMADEKRSEINGWTLDEIKQDWFERFSLNEHHATRDSYRLGNGRRLIKIAPTE